MPNERLLIVEDERIIAEDIKRTLNNFGYQVIDIVSNGKKAISIVRDQNPDLVLMDINLDGKMNGVEVAKNIHVNFGTPVVYLTAYADNKTLEKAKIAQPFGYILKPFEERELHATIEMAFYKYKMERELREQEELLRKVVDSNPNYIYVKDEEGRYLMVNTAAASLYNTEPKDMIGKTEIDLSEENWLREDDAKRFLSNDLEFIAKKLNEQTIEEVFVTKNGELKYFQNSRIALTHKNNPKCILGVAVDITERKKNEEKIKKSNKKLKDLLEETVQGLVSAVEMRDPYTAGHQRRVAKLACEIAAKIGFEEDRIDGLRMAGLLHDIGKMYVPAEILTKPGNLSDIEFNLIKIHPQAGYDILKSIEFPWDIAKFVLQHHELINGSGYPHGLKGDEITLESKILCVADVVESMSSHRPYRATLGIYAALKEIKTNQGILYDKTIVDVCLDLFETDKFEF